MTTINELKERTGNKYNGLIDRFLFNNEACLENTERDDKLILKVNGLVFFKYIKEEDFRIDPCVYCNYLGKYSFHPVRYNLDKNELYINTWSMVVNLINTENLQEDIDNYNKSITTNDRYKITHVLFEDGTIYEARI